MARNEGTLGTSTSGAAIPDAAPHSANPVADETSETGPDVGWLVALAILLGAWSLAEFFLPVAGRWLSMTPDLIAGFLSTLGTPELLLVH